MSESSVEKFEAAAKARRGGIFGEVKHFFHLMFGVPDIWLLYEGKYWTACYACGRDFTRRAGPPPPGALFAEFETKGTGK